MEDREGWETIQMDGQTVGIKTSAIEEKCQAFETLVIYSSTIGARFAPYLAQSLELALPALRFYFHDGVREAAAMCVSILSHKLLEFFKTFRCEQASFNFACMWKEQRLPHAPNGIRHFSAADKLHIRRVGLVLPFITLQMFHRCTSGRWRSSSAFT